MITSRNVAANQGNRVLRNGLAVVDSKVTGLAGCSNSKNFGFCTSCLRADPALTFLSAMDCTPDDARYFILSGQDRS